MVDFGFGQGRRDLSRSYERERPVPTALKLAQGIVGQWDAVDTVLTIIAADLKFSETMSFNTHTLIQRVADGRECDYGRFQRDFNL